MQANIAWNEKSMGYISCHLNDRIMLYSFVHEESRFRNQSPLRAVIDMPGVDHLPEGDGNEQPGEEWFFSS